MAGRQLSHRNEGSATLGSARTRFLERLIAASTGTVAFLCYYATLLPGLDLGDSASFQTTVGSLTLTPRQAYPLYHALGNLFVWVHPGEPARAMNLASAVYGAVAVAMATLLASRLAESLIAGLTSGLFLAFSYTFWSQAITAEVYTLHLLMVGATLLALLSWAEHPTVPRLAVFYGVYAFGFGNHLSMILLLPGVTAFLLVHRHRGVANPLRARMLALAVGLAAAGALQYAWNFRGMWAEIEQPASLTEALESLWFDVTKSDWRQTLVMSLSESGLQSRPAMYWFDVCQQFGVPGVSFAALGFSYITVRWPKRALLLGLLYFGNLLFAWTYNVGDAYIFFLPSHYVIALCAGAGIAAIVAILLRLSRPTVAVAAGALFVLYPLWRGVDTFPAVDRSRDNRAFTLLDQFTMPSTTRGSRPLPSGTVIGVDTNWQVQNAFEYFMRERRPGIPWFFSEELEWLQLEDAGERFRQFVNANAEIGREILAAPVLYKKLAALGYQGAAEAVRSDLFASKVMAVRHGTPYALAVLRPDREYPLDKPSLDSAWQWLTGGAVTLPEMHAFTVAVGRVGETPALIASQERPYRVRTRVGSHDFDIRMESWLPTDTIRRAGFGHVIVGRAHLLTLERGISFAAVGGEPVYSSGLFAPIPRLVLIPNP